MRDVADDADFEARSQNRAVQVVSSDSCSIKGVEELLRSAVENVVRNAVRYTPEGTAVEVALRKQNGGSDNFAVISVRDRGHGVPEDALEKIFRPFYRTEDARDRQSGGGTGLGLAITERAVRMHGGSVQAANAAGGGLSVEMRLPFRQDSQMRLHPILSVIRGYPVALLFARLISTNLITMIQIKRCRESRDDVCGVVHAQIDSRQANHKKHHACPIQMTARTRFLLIRAVSNCSEGAEETAAHERVSTRKTVRLGWQQVEERSRPCSFECQLESDIQQRAAEHRERE